MNEILSRNKGDGFVAEAVASQPIESGNQTARLNSIYARFGKRFLDVCIVILSAPIFLPIVLLCALALWIESGLPFYTQQRLGKNGKVFAILKLRTMVRNADAMLEIHLRSDSKLRAEWNATQKLKNDPRITPIGKFLRVTSLDELPQVWNVIKGDMSLVGPRPMMPDQLELYGDPEAYFAVRPGISGKWQVCARNESSFTLRQVFDREYACGMCFTEDARIIKRTVGVVLRGTGY